jgi:hypothetical protein
VDLLLCAKHLFVAAIGGRVRAKCAAPCPQRKTLPGASQGDAGNLCRSERPVQRDLLRSGDGQNAMHDASGGGARRPRAVAMSGDRLEVNVTFDSARGYIASAPELRQPIVALSLGSLRKRIEIALLSDEVVLQLDGLAERERHRRQAQA